MFSNNFTPKKPNIFICEKCEFYTSNKKDFNRHISNKKHISNEIQCFYPEKTHYQCCCGKTYKDNSGLWRHKKKCESFYKNNENYVEEPELNKDSLNFTSKMFYDLLKQNNELQKSLIEMSKEKSSVINNNNNCNNKTFNCSDSKRETLYIKNDDQWTKDDEQKTILTNAIKQVAGKNIKQISEWQKLHPEYNDPESKQNDKYMKIVLNSMSGSTKEEADKNYEKIVKNVIKETVIEK
jgi:hypothetical protein